MSDIDKILAEREKTHGDFSEHAEITQSLKKVLRDRAYLKGRNISYEMEESLDMIFHKIGRIVAGDPYVVDHWDDIAGYATLVANILRKM